MDFSKVKSMVIQDSPRSRGLPYDAEVEYLENSGKQIISLGLVFTPRDRIEADFRFTSVAYAYRQQRVFSQRTSTGLHVEMYIAGSGKLSYAYERDNLTGWIATSYNPNTDRKTYVLDGPNRTMSDGTHAWSIPDLSSMTDEQCGTSAMYIWRTADTISSRAQLFGVRFWKSGILAGDFIPVRVGNIGYLYDKVSGQLFGNQGTGDFILGPDVALENLVVRKIWNNGQIMWQRAKPYDAEVEYIESTGTQYVDTGIAVADPKEITIEISCFGNLYCGFTHQNNVNGTWLGLSNDSAWWGKFGNRYQFSDSGARQLLKWDGSNGFSRNSVLEKAFSASIGVDSISEKTWPLFGVYDFNKNEYSFRVGIIYATRIWVSGTLVRDFQPVRVGTVGYLYDRVSGRLFGNAGTDAFIVGPDIVPIEYLESTGSQYIISDSTDAWDRFIAVFQPTSNANAQRLITDFYGQRCIYVNNNGKMAASMDATWQPTNLIPNQYKFKVEYNVADKKTYFATTDGTTLAVTTHSSAQPLLQPKIFAYQSSASASYYPGYMRLFNITVWDAQGVLIRDFIPCRAGTTGYLLDKVSGKLFGNSGTGDFILGSDIALF